MKISIGAKILALLGLSSIVGLGVTLTSVRSTGELVSSSAWVAHTYKVINGFDEIRSLLKDAETGQRGFLITGEPSYLAPYENALKKIDEQLASLRELTADNPNQQSRLVSLRPLIDSKLSELAQTIALRKTTGFESARKVVMTDLGKNVMDQIRSTIDQGTAEENSLLAKRDRVNVEFAAMARNGLLGGSLLLVIVFIATAVFVRRGIIVPLTLVMGVAKEVASGNLKQEPLRVNSTDEIGELANIINTMLAFLREMATQNLDVARNLGTATSEILAAIQQQAAAVREQATAIQQTTTTMEEIGQSGAQVNERGRQISNSAELTLGAASAGIGAVQGTNLTMVSIRSQVESVAENIVNLSERNQTIGEIITSVNDIAEQCNLLALNAAIEAADAGDHGRRFSVVANEIKT